MVVLVLVNSSLLILLGHTCYVRASLVQVSASLTTAGSACYLLHRMWPVSLRNVGHFASWYLQSTDHLTWSKQKSKTAHINIPWYTDHAPSPFLVLFSSSQWILPTFSFSLEEGSRNGLVDSCLSQGKRARSGINAACVRLASVSVWVYQLCFVICTLFGTKLTVYR